MVAPRDNVLAADRFQSFGRNAPMLQCTAIGTNRDDAVSRRRKLKSENEIKQFA